MMTGRRRPGVRARDANFLYEVAPTDPITLALVSAGVLTLVAGGALVPARRPAHTDPMTVLRSE